jgi:uncharacterized membrane protein YfcA
LEYIILLIVGFIAGTIGSLVGLGGGIVIVPLLTGLGALLHLPNVSPQLAVGTSIVTVVFTGLSSTLSYMKHKRVDYKSGLLFFLGSGPGSMVGSWANQFFNQDSFSLYFGIFMIAVSVLLMLKEKLKSVPFSKKRAITRSFITEEGKTVQYGFHPATAVILSFLIGGISGLFGVGGGSLLVPAMLLLFAFPPHIAVATSMLVVFLSSVTGSITHILLGNVIWLYALLLVPGAWAGGRFGAYINMKLSGKTIINILRAVLIMIGARMIYQSLF